MCVLEVSLPATAQLALKERTASIVRETEIIAAKCLKFGIFVFKKSISEISVHDLNFT